MLRLVTPDHRRYLARSWAIARRYVVVNGFDGAFTMLGLMTGLHISGDVELDVVIGASLGAAVALSVSGVTSAYLSESAERQRALTELEAAMITDLSATAEGRTARFATWVIAVANGAAPLIVSLVIICPLWLANAGVPMPIAPLLVAIATAFCCVFGLGTFLGEVGGTFWLTSGLKAVILAAATTCLILLLELGVHAG
jgi:predicted membrane protein (TIGR00267 family)